MVLETPKEAPKLSELENTKKDFSTEFSGLNESINATTVDIFAEEIDTIDSIDDLPLFLTY